MRPKLIPHTSFNQKVLSIIQKSGYKPEELEALMYEINKPDLPEIVKSLDDVGLLALNNSVIVEADIKSVAHVCHFRRLLQSFL